MKPFTAESSSDKKGHLCPPSNATHPSDRWESLFVYAFICKFTQLRGKVEGFDTPMDFEEALLSPEANPVMTQILSRFVLNLRPQTRNLKSESISSTVAALLQEYLKSSERTVFWDEELKANIDPFQSLEGGFWGADWDLKLRILRQLVELQLCHSVEIKGIIDRAWGVVHNKHKKHETTAPPPPASDPHSIENLQLNPLGQDGQRKRYWVIDDSPRVYLSTNPWKITATFRTVSSTRDEYITMTNQLKESTPSEPKGGEKRTKLELHQLALVKALEDRLVVIDAELARIHRARKKIEQRNLLLAQAEIRETRTRRRTTRVDYAYLNDPDEGEDDQDEYTYQEDEEYDDQAFNDDDFLNFRTDEPTSARRAAPDTGRRRSTRTTKTHGNGNRAAPDEWTEWRGERRSARLGTSTDTHIDEPPPKRARTEESTASTSSMDVQTTLGPPVGSGLKIKIAGAAAIKPTETAVETVAGKKKSKFWYYAVEPIPGAPGELPPPAGQNGAGPSTSNGHQNGAHTHIDGDVRSHSEVPSNMDIYEKSIEGSLSPTPSMDES